ncbi:DUF1559 domain-containing protein [Lacipirellula parvula]|uniref:DUF1559 domain-containing protein n=1 Tax=Lacipirellula parvula TaxID=2650471 RepID=A0A5K7XFK0_9BACT|nr:DUF1559 domain-containing protein [Lacipirellula parvula]BBO35288.1 hypothetical protein PLANPX_4900 [Lacipirellula parvula]
MSPLRAFPTFHLSLCLTLALSTAFAPSLGIAQEAAARPAASASESSANLEYVIPSAVVVLIAKPEQILKSSAAELFPIEILQAASIQETGLDPLEASEVVLSVSPPIAGPPSYSLLATFNDDATLKASAIARHTEQTTLADKIVEIYNGVREALSDKIAEQARQALASDDPIQQAAGRYSQRMQKKWDAVPGLVQEGDRIVLFRADLTKSEGNQLVYVATVGTLVGLLLPAVQAAREAARRNQAMNNMKQIVLGMYNYESAKAAFPTDVKLDADGKPLLSWRVLILPYIEEYELYKQFHLDEPWDSPHNKTLISKMPPVFLDPSSKLTPADGKTSYLGVKGDAYFFNGSAKGRSFSSVRDGTSNTIAFVQVDDEAAVTWTKPQDWTPSESDLLKPFDGPHPGGFFAGFCDGHISFISSSIDPTMLRALLTANGGEVIESR